MSLTSVNPETVPVFGMTHEFCEANDGIRDGRVQASKSKPAAIARAISFIGSLLIFRGCQ